MSAKVPRLSGPLGELQRRGYGGAAVRLVMEWGGGKRYVPFVAKPGQKLVGIMGLAAAQALGDITREQATGAGDFRGEGKYLDLPSRSTLEPTLKGEILRHGGTDRQVAQDLGCTERYVRLLRQSAGKGRMKKSRPKDDRQADWIDLLQSEV